MRFKVKNRCDIWEKLKRTAVLVFSLFMLLHPVCVNAQDGELIGAFGADNYGNATMGIVRHTTVKEDGTVTVRFDLKKEIRVKDFLMWVLRFRYDTQKMTLINYTNGTVDLNSTKSDQLDYIPYTVLSEFWSAQNLAPGTICTLEFAVKDTSDSTDVFGVSRPYYWVDLGGEEEPGRPNPVTVYMDGSLNYYKINLYEGTVVCEHPDTSHINVVEATCTEEGSYDVFCNTCKKIISEGNVVEALMHAYGKWQPRDEKTHIRVCANDSSHVENGEHRFGEWQIVTEATATVEGSRKKSCKDCGYTLTEDVGMLEKPNSSDTNISEAKVPKTGDYSLGWLWSILCILSIGSVKIFCRKRRFFEKI